MITEAQRAEAIATGDRGISKREVRSYEVSLWTLQDEFITVLKWSDAEQQGRIRDPSLTLNVDGTQNFSFTIPMYLNVFEEGDRDNPRIHNQSRMVKKENPIWYNTRNGNLITSMRKVKVIFDKGTANKKVYDFIINKVTEEHQGEQLLCKVECEGQAFHELGKIGYKYELNQDVFALDMKDWDEKGYWTKPDGTVVYNQPKATVQYWCERCGLKPRPLVNINPREWYYQIDMGWGSYDDADHRAADIVYEDTYVSSWDADLRPLAIEPYKEKARVIDVKESNLYNITQTIAETFKIYCRYDYEHDDNQQITSRTIVFYNNYIKDRDNVISFTYPYSSTSISREMDSTELTTKMYVRCDDDSNTLEGTISIMNSDANKMGEDYIFNFDYFHDTGAITEEQYAAISTYEKDMHNYNEQLLTKSLQIDAKTTQKTELEAKQKVLDNSISYDKEQVNYASSLFNNITTDGYIIRNEKNPYSTYIRVDTNTGAKFITFNDQDKGIDIESVRIYKTYKSSQCVLEDLIETSNYNFGTDKEYAEVTRVNLNITLTEQDSKLVYVTYRYSPKLYYDAVIETWQHKQSNDEVELNIVNTTIETLTSAIETLQQEYDNLLIEKDKKILAFNAMMGPALREGYWQPEDYTDEGDHYTESDTFTSTYSATPMLADTGTSIKVGWDNELFDSEDKIYYEESVLLDHVYYPCVDISGSTLLNYVANNFTTSNVQADNKISFVFQNNYYKELTAAQKNEVQNFTNFTLGADAMLAFIRTHDNNIKPVIVLTGTKSMTDEEIKFMLNPSLGNPRLGLVRTTVDNETNIATTSISAIQSISTDLIYWETSKINDNDRAIGLTGIHDITQCETVYPRLKFTSMRLKTKDTDTFKIFYNDHLLSNYSDYYLLNRVTIRDNKAYPETFITIKPNTMIKAATYTATATAKYALSNAATSIYLDAKDVMLESAYPKVSYTIKTSILQPEFVKNLYRMLTQLVMINDTELKFSNVFGYISEVKLNLDQPQNDEIEVKNYKTKFEDLFSAIVAQTEEMKRNNAGLAVAIAGGAALSEGAFSTTILQNGDILQAFLDSYFDSSDVVAARLNSIFAEAGRILADANTALNKARSSTLENATILGGFIENISDGLIPKVFTQQNQPTEYKVGDIWNQTNNSGVIIARYIATADSADSNAGWVRTFNGALASITGASLEVDAVAGTVAILAQNQIDIQSGGNVEIAANENVNIYGNKAVNIGGTTINIGSTVVNNETITGSINLVAAAYDTNNIANASASKVLISPYNINMSAADIYMKGGRKILSVASNGTSNGTSAIQISTSDGIWIGSGNGVKLYGGNAFSYNDSTKSLQEVMGASVELNSEHLLLGYSANAQAAIEMTDDYLVIADGIAIPEGTQGSQAALIATGITGLTTGLVGAKFTRTSIGLAVGSGSNIHALLMNSNGISLGAGPVDLRKTTNELRYDYENNNGNGSYMRIAGDGIEFGSLANMYINTNNFKLQTDSINAADLTKTDIGNTILAIGKKLQNINTSTTIAALRTMIANGTAQVDLVLNKYGLYISGTVFASAFQASCTNGYFRADGTQLGFYDANAAAMMTLTGDTMTCHQKFSILGDNLYIGNKNITTIFRDTKYETVEECVKVYHAHNSTTGAPSISGGNTTTADPTWTVTIPAPSGANVHLWSAIRTRTGDGKYHYGNPVYEQTLDEMTEVTQVEYTRSNSSVTVPDITNDSIWSLYIPDAEYSTTATTSTNHGFSYSTYAITNPYVWKVIAKIDRQGTKTRGTPICDLVLQNIDQATVTAANIANGTLPVPTVASTGIAINGNSLVVGATGTAKIVGNSGVELYTAADGSGQAGIIMKASGISLGTTASISLAAGANITLLSNNNTNAVKLDSNGIEIYSGKKLKISATDLELTGASTITLSVAMSNVEAAASADATSKANAAQAAAEATASADATSKANAAQAAAIAAAATDATTKANAAETAAKTTISNYMKGITAFEKIQATGIELAPNSFKLTSTGTLEIAAEAQILIRANAAGTNNALVLNKDGITVTTNGKLDVSSNNLIINSQAGANETVFSIKDSSGNLLIQTTPSQTIISGWHLDPYWLWGGQGTNCVVLVGPNVTGYGDLTGTDSNNNTVTRLVRAGDWAIYAGGDYPEEPPPNLSNTTGPGWAPFRVRRDGSVIAKHLCIGNGPWALSENQTVFQNRDSSASGGNHYDGNWSGYTGYLWFWVAGTDSYSQGGSTYDNEPCWKWIKIDGQQLYNLIESVETLQTAVKSVQVTQGVAASQQIADKPKSSHGCFVAGSLVTMADGSTLPIERLNQGMHVLSYNLDTKEYEIAEVALLQALPHKKYIYDVKLTNGETLTLTDSHPILTPNGWKAINIEAAKREHYDPTVKTLRIHDEVITTDSDHVYVTDIQRRWDLQDITVYNCNICPYHTFVVNKTIVHNVVNFVALKA